LTEYPGGKIAMDGNDTESDQDRKNTGSFVPLNTLFRLGSVDIC